MEYNHHVHIITVTDPVDRPLVEDVSILEFVNALNHLNAAMPMVSLDFERKAEGLPAEWEYRFLPVVDHGTKWKQNLTLIDPADPTMDFKFVKGLWKESQFKPHRLVRTLCVAYARLMPELREIHVTFPAAAT